MSLQKIQERGNRKKLQEIAKKKNEEQTVLSVIQNKGIRLGTSEIKGSSTIALEDLEAHHPAAQVK